MGALRSDSESDGEGGGICYLFRHLKEMIFHDDVLLDLRHELKLTNKLFVVFQG